MVYVCQDVMRQILQMRKVMMWNDKLKIYRPVVWDLSWSDLLVVSIKIGKFKVIKELTIYPGHSSQIVCIYKQHPMGFYRAVASFIE